MLSFNKLNIKKILQYMDFLKNNSPRHRFRFSQQAWLSQDKTADPVLRRLHERLIRLKYCKVTNIERGPVFYLLTVLRCNLNIIKCRMFYWDLKLKLFPVLQDHYVNQAPKKNSSGWRTNAGKRFVW